MLFSGIFLCIIKMKKKEFNAIEREIKRLKILCLLAIILSISVEVVLYSVGLK